MIKNLENKFWNILVSISPRVHDVLFRHQRALKYIISGGTSAAVNLLLLYFFTDILKVWYIISAGMSFVVAFIVSFCFQKFWTFEDHSTEAVHMQAAAYFFVAVINLAINLGLIYCFVEFAAIHYLVAQIMSGIIIAFESFFVYRHFIFKSVTTYERNL